MREEIYIGNHYLLKLDDMKIRVFKGKRDFIVVTEINEGEVDTQILTREELFETFKSISKHTISKLWP